ncbi:MAG TPA: hypothetical protein VMU24_01105 [Candidatus Acidoferrales bacterium]|nr:hypothetical protein [Candidatus Acidoferrales bacterium]
MATLTAIAYNVFEVIGIAQPRIEVMVREPLEYECSARQPLRMQWVREKDSDGRNIMRVRWVEDIERSDKTDFTKRSN